MLPEFQPITAEGPLSGDGLRDPPRMRFRHLFRLQGDDFWDVVGVSSRRRDSKQVQTACQHESCGKALKRVVFHHERMANLSGDGTRP